MPIATSEPVVVLSLLGLFILVLDAYISLFVVAYLKPILKPTTVAQPSNKIGKNTGSVRKELLNNPPVSSLTSVDESAGDIPSPQKPSLAPALLDNVNHEIRTPLAGIMAAAQVLHDELGPHHQEFTEMLVENSRRMNNAISNVIDLVMLEKEEYQVDTAELNLEEEIDALVAPHQKSAHAKGIQLNVLPFHQNLTLQTDPQLLRKVLNQLLSNAIKFTDAGAVSLKVKLDDQWVHVEIKDTGSGIPKAFLPALCNPFTPGSQRLTRTHNGQGLGLALTRRMIDLAGAKIDVNSAPGAGSTFTVSYPKTPKQQN